MGVSDWGVVGVDRKGNQERYTSTLLDQQFSTGGNGPSPWMYLEMSEDISYGLSLGMTRGWVATGIRWLEARDTAKMSFSAQSGPPPTKNCHLTQNGSSATL